MLSLDSTYFIHYLKQAVLAPSLSIMNDLSFKH